MLPLYAALSDGQESLNQIRLQSREQAQIFTYYLRFCIMTACVLNSAIKFLYLRILYYGVSPGTPDYLANMTVSLRSCV